MNSNQNSSGNTQVNPIQAATEALKKGVDVEQAVRGETSSNDNSSTELSPNIEDASESIQIVSSSDSEEIVSPQKKSESQKIEQKQSNQPKVEDKLRAYEKGMRKFQTERDLLKKEKQELEAKYNELKDYWDALEDAFAKEGELGVLSLIAGGNEAAEKILENYSKKKEFLQNASPEELNKFYLEERLKELEYQNKEEKRRAKALEDKLNNYLQTAELKEAQSTINPIFDKYRFSGKLGDPEAEYYYDSAMWDHVLTNLSRKNADSLTRDEIEAEFKKVSSAFKKVIKSNSETKVNKILESKKRAAAENAAISAMRGMTTSQAVDSFKNNVRKGNLTDALKQLISGKIKLV